MRGVADADAADDGADALRARCRAHARDAARAGANESALRWITLALARGDWQRTATSTTGDASSRERETRTAWRAMASDHALKGEILAAMGSHRASAESYLRAIDYAARSGDDDDDARTHSKRGSKSSSRMGDDDGGDVVNVNDMRLHAARSLCALQETEATEAALKHLTLVPASERVLEHKLLLAYIHRLMQNDRVAVTYYKDVLKEYPWAIEAAVALGELGVKTVDVRHALRKATTVEEAESEEFAVLETYTSVLGALEVDDIASARSSLSHMASAFPNDSYMMCASARADAYGGRDVDSALRQFASVRARDPYFTEDMDYYAKLLYEALEGEKLRELSASMMELTPESHQTWTCAAYYSDYSISRKVIEEGKFPRSGSTKAESIIAAEKAVRLSGGRSHMALITLGSMCLKNKRYQEGIAAFNQSNAIKLSMHAFKGLVHAYLATGSGTSAMMYAKQAIKRAPQDGMAWSLVGDVHAKKTGDTESAIKAYEQALAYNPRLLRAVKAIAALNVKIGKIHVARAVLQRQLDDYQPTHPDELVSLYCRLAQVLMLSRQPTESVKYYQRALAVNPDCTVAAKALDKFEQTRNVEFAAGGGPDAENISSGEEDDMEEDIDDDAGSGQDGDWMVEGQ